MYVHDKKDDNMQKECMNSEMENVYLECCKMEKKSNWYSSVRKLKLSFKKTKGTSSTTTNLSKPATHDAETADSSDHIYEDISDIQKKLKSSSRVTCTNLPVISIKVTSSS